jgi:hypothetical protein
LVCRLGLEVLLSLLFALKSQRPQWDAAQLGRYDGSGRRKLDNGLTSG